MPSKQKQIHFYINEWFYKLVVWIRLRFNETYVSPATTTSSPSSLTTNRPMSPLEPERFSFGLTLPENGLLWWNAAAGTLGYALIWFPIFLKNYYVWKLTRICNFSLFTCSNPKNIWVKYQPRKYMPGI
jgi:hypothetical protein